MIPIHVSADLVSIVRLGVLEADGLTVLERDPALDAPFAETERRVRETPPAEREAVRHMYRRIGLDPTRRRPSSEALLRRVRRGAPLPRVNSLVDVCNWCSVELQLPYGCYDAGRVAGDVELRLGRPGEAYAGIRKDEVHVEGRMTLADPAGPFGNPSSDSARTMVTPATTHALVVVFVPHELGDTVATRALEITASRLVQACGGREIARFVV